VSADAANGATSARGSAGGGGGQSGADDEATAGLFGRQDSDQELPYLETTLPQVWKTL